MKNITIVSHNDKSYELKIDGWFNHLDSNSEKALAEIITDDIVIVENMKVSEFKDRIKSNYKLLSDKKGLSYKRYLDQEIAKIYGVNWEQCIESLKREIHNAFVSTLQRDRSQKMTEKQQYELLKAASNGHVAAMFFIGIALADGGDETALMWLSMAHNSGHLGACYEMSIFFRKHGNIVDSLRCLILAADKGMDQAYMSLFHLEHLKELANYSNPNELHLMLDEFITARPDSGARFFKGVLFLAKENIPRGQSLLNAFLKNPKNKRTEPDNNSVYENQVDYARKVIGEILYSIKKGVSPPIIAVFNACQSSDAISFDDHHKIVEMTHKIAT